MEVDNDEEHSDSCHQVHQVGEVLSVESLTETPNFVGSGGKEMEESDNGSLELGSLSGVDGGRAERLPNDRLTDVGGNEQGDSGMRRLLEH